MTRALLACSFPLVVFLAFLLLVGVAFWWVRRHGQERRALWHSLATPLGFEVVEGRNVPLGDPQRARLLARFGGAFGTLDPFGPEAIPFPEDPAFDRTFEVLTPDSEATRTLLTPTTRAALLEHGPRWRWEGFERTLTVTDGGLADRLEVVVLLQGLEAVARALPRR